MRGFDAAGENVRPRALAEGWWVRKEREGVCGEEFEGGGERRDVREERSAVFWERVWRRARFSFLVSRSLVRRASRDSGVGVVGRSGRERFCWGGVSELDDCYLYVNRKCTLPSKKKL